MKRDRKKVTNYSGGIEVLMNWGLIIIYICLSVGGQVLFKYGTKRDFFFSFNNGAINFMINWLCIIGGACYVASFFLFLVLISKYNLNQISPILIGATYIFSFICSLVILHEKVSIMHAMGIATIFIGILLIIFNEKA